MNADALRAAQAPLKEQYKASSETALVPMSITGRLDRDKIACHLPERETGFSGLHRAAGGQEQSLCSGDILLESLVACAGVTLCAVATAMGIEFSEGTVTASGDVDFRGTLGVDRETPVGMQNLKLVFQLTTSADREKLDKLLQLTERYCVIYQTLVRENEIESSLATS